MLVVDIPAVSLGFGALTEMMNLHPLFVHFPIALFVTSVVFYFLGLILRNTDLLSVARWTLYAGTVGAAFAVWSGLMAEKTVPHGGGVHDLMDLHKKFGIAVLILSVILAAWTGMARQALPGKGRPVFLFLLLIMGAVLGQASDFGAQLVYLNGVGVGRKSMLEQTQASEKTAADHVGHAHEHEHEHAH